MIERREEANHNKESERFLIGLGVGLLTGMVVGFLTFRFGHKELFNTIKKEKLLKLLNIVSNITISEKFKSGFTIGFVIGFLVAILTVFIITKAKDGRNL